MAQEKEENGGILGYLLRRRKEHKYSFEDTDDKTTEDNASDGAVRRRTTQWQRRLGKHAADQTLETFRQKERDRMKEVRSKASEAQRQRNRELQRIRQAQYRERKRRMASEATTRSAKDKLRQELDAKKLSHREYMRRWRSTHSEEKKRILREQRRERYYNKKRDPAAKGERSGVTEPPPESLPLTGSPFKTDEARRKAASRAGQGDPQDPVKYAQVKQYQLAQASKSPRKKAALEAVGLCPVQEPAAASVKGRIADRLLSYLEKLKGDGSKESTDLRRQILSVVILGESESINKLSKELRQRWHFVAAASVLDCEKEEIMGSAARHGNCLPGDLCQAVAEFFTRPDTSIHIPDRKAVKKDLVPKCCLTQSLEVLHQQFLAETGMSLSLTSFKRMRPQHVLCMDNIKKTSCLCKMCANVSQKLETLKPLATAAGISFPATLSAAVDLTMCAGTDEVSRWACIELKCDACRTKRLGDHFKALPNKEVSWQRWEPHKSASGQRLVNITKKGHVEDLLQELNTEMCQMPRHLAVAKWQYSQFRQLRDNLQPGHLLTLMDFAENYRCEFQDEVQAAHWSYSQVTVFPTVNYYRCECQQLVTESVVIVSDDLQHDAAAVHHYNSLLLKHLEEKRNLRPQKQFQFTDGAGSQFKSREPFSDISCSVEDHGVPVERSFFGSSHGKGPCDGVGGVVKAAARRAVLGKRVVIQNGQEMFDFLSKSFTDDPQDACSHSKRVFLFVAGDSVDRKRSERRPKNPVPGTRKIHCVKADQRNVIHHRQLSCYCMTCLNGDDCRLIKKLEHGVWNTHVFQTSRSCKRPATRRPPASSPPVPEASSATPAAGPSPSFTYVNNGPTPAVDASSSSSPEAHIPLSAQVSSPPIPSARDPSQPTHTSSPSLPEDHNRFPQFPEAVSTPSTSTADQGMLAKRKRDYFEKLQMALRSTDSFAAAREVALQEMEALREFPVRVSAAVLESIKHKHQPDMMALELLPSDAPALSPFSVYGDGNCLPRCLSVLAADTQDLHDEMRIRIFMELVEGEDFYLTHECLAQGYKNTTADLPKAYASYSDKYVNEYLNAGAIRYIFEKEAFDILTPGTFMGMWQVHAVSSILGTCLHVVFPEYAGHTVRKDLNRVVMPRVKAGVPAPYIPGIMWSHTQGRFQEHLTEANWRPNHFVFCAPDEVSLLDMTTNTLDEGFIGRSEQTWVPAVNNFVQATFQSQGRRRNEAMYFAKVLQVLDDGSECLLHYLIQKEGVYVWADKAWHSTSDIKGRVKSPKLVPGRKLAFVF